MQIRYLMTTVVMTEGDTVEHLNPTLLVLSHNLTKLESKATKESCAMVAHLCLQQLWMPIDPCQILSDLRSNPPVDLVDFVG